MIAVIGEIIYIRQTMELQFEFEIIKYSISNVNQLVTICTGVSVRLGKTG